MANNNESWVNTFKGVVISSKRWSDTHVESSGRVNQYLSSDVVQKSEVFVRSTDGKESSFVFSDIRVPMREGSNIFVVWASEGGAAKGDYYYVENLDTKDKHQPIAWMQRKSFNLFSMLWKLPLFFVGSYAVILIAATAAHFLLHVDLLSQPMSENEGKVAGALSAIGALVAGPFLSIKNAVKYNRQKSKLRESFYSLLMKETKAVGFLLVAKDMRKMVLERA